jgi:GT2 family glycosyltransferase
MNPPIVISTVHGRGLPVLLESIRQYAPNVQVYLKGPEKVVSGYGCTIILGEATNFGDDYNMVINRALSDGHGAVVIANDDIVLTPSSYRVLLDDVEICKELNQNPGLVASRSDAVRPIQNVRFSDGEKLNGMKFSHESFVKQLPVVSPIFAWMSAEAFEDCQFPPINYFSDDVICIDLVKKGYRHFLSASYVHHIGSSTIGRDAQQLTLAAKPWIEQHRPSYAKEWFK